MTDTDRYITVAIHTYDAALSLRALLESEGISVELNNINIDAPAPSSGVRVRIPQADLPLALRIIENKELFSSTAGDARKRHAMLVPVDLTEVSYKAARAALRLAKKLRADITFLYSYIDPYIAGNVQFTDKLTYEVGESGARKALRDNARRLLEYFADRLRAEMKNGLLPPVKFDITVSEGVPEDSIAEYAGRHKPHIIVMGTRGSDRKDSDMIGSVTGEVLDEGRFTVLSLPSPCDEEQILSPKNILFMCNLQQTDILAMDTLCRTFTNTDATVTLMPMPSKRSVSTVTSEKVMEIFCRYCIENYPGFTFSVRPEGISDVSAYVAGLQHTKPYDLIVIPNRRRNAFRRLFNPGLTQKLLFNADIPMLVIPV